MQPRLPRTLDEAAYGAGQLAAFFQIMALQQVLIRLRKRDKSFDRNAAKEFRRRFYTLLERDLHNVEEGLYPRELLFQMPVRQYLGTVPEFMRDLPKLLGKALNPDEEELEKELQLDRYPAYYHRHFPWHEDGYLNDKAARLYDMTVELLFAGAADVMRRQMLAPISRYFKEYGGTGFRLLDVGCGTGRFLKQLSAAHPDVRLFGVDISPSIINEARRTLEDVDDVSLVVENAERLPFRDGYFEVVTTCFLFHELPMAARRSVMTEVFRVLRPGGLLVIEDSAQRPDGEASASFLQGFSEFLHEPSFQHYLDDDLVKLASRAGFETQPAEVHWVARVVEARKPVPQTDPPPAG